MAMQRISRLSPLFWEKMVTFILFMNVVVLWNLFEQIRMGLSMSLRHRCFQLKAPKNIALR